MEILLIVPFGIIQVQVKRSSGLQYSQIKEDIKSLRQSSSPEIYEIALLSFEARKLVRENSFLVEGQKRDIFKLNSFGRFLKPPNDFCYFIKSIELFNQFCHSINRINLPRDSLSSSSPFDSFCNIIYLFKIGVSF